MTDQTTRVLDSNYCPDNPATRAEMTVFLMKTFDLP